ncbi:MAG: DUF4838 domain-containing protein [Lentisphaerae bacterium]|jgi:hypothetical protein|nr:DUF4838 domain-containing protein [Lentisphaerota bacterium]
MMKRLALVVAMLAVTASAFEIVIPDQNARLAFPPEEGYEYPAEFLQRHIMASTGKSLSVVKESTATPEKRKIFLGATRAAGKFSFALNPEGFILQPDGRDLIICGEVFDGVDRGTLFGVYEFLERQFGIRWLYPGDRLWAGLGDGTIIPKHDEITFPYTPVQDAPRLWQREGGISYEYQPIAVQKRWHPMLRFGTSMPHRNANHTQIYWVDLYADKHPEYFAKGSDGQPRINYRHKTRTYICLSSDAVLQQMLDNLEAFDQGTATGKEWGPCLPNRDYVFFCCNDGMIPESTCHCPDCAAALEMDRNYAARGTELFFRFVTKYANAINEKWPGRRLVTLAYSHYLAPPVHSQIPANLDLAYVGPQVQYANDPAVFDLHRQYLSRWSELVGHDRKRLTLWMNIVTPTLGVSNAPFFYPHTLKRFLLASENEIGGAFINGLSPYLRRLGAEGRFGGVQTFPMVWIQARLLWNPDADVDALLTEYCQYAYGKGAAVMEEFFQLIGERWENMYKTNTSLSELDYIHQVRYPLPVVAKMKSLLAQALADAKDEPEAARRIAYMTDTIYSRFFEESETYQKRSGILPVYECLPTSIAPVLDGNPGDEVWRDAVPVELVRYRFGDKSPRRSTVKMIHNKGKLYFLAEFFAPVEKDELRIQAAIAPDGLRSKYSPNILKNWRCFREIQIYQDGKATRYGPFPPCDYKMAHADGRWIIEGMFDTEGIVSGSVGIPVVRLQFMRYFDQWNEFDIWSPTMGGITDYPTWKFGVVQLLPSSEEENDGLR